MRKKLPTRKKKSLPKTFTVEDLNFSGKEVRQLEKKFGLKNLCSKSFGALCRECKGSFGNHSGACCPRDW